MRPTQAESTQNVAERWYWEVARRGAGRLYRRQEVNGVYRLDEGAVLDDFFHCLAQIGVMALMKEVRGTAIQREMIPFVQYVLLYGLKMWCSIERLPALPPLLCSDEALRQLVGFNAQQVRACMCQRGASTRQGERTPGPICHATLANKIVPGNVRALECVFNGAIRALAKASVFSKQVTGIVHGTALQTTARYRSCGPVTRKIRREDTQGQVHAIQVMGYGWKGLLLSEAATKMPLGVKSGQSPEHETHARDAGVGHPGPGQFGGPCAPATRRLL